MSERPLPASRSSGQVRLEGRQREVVDATIQARTHAGDKGFGSQQSLEIILDIARRKLSW